jgi:hypothetical protein
MRDKENGNGSVNGNSFGNVNGKENRVRKDNNGLI